MKTAARAFALLLVVSLTAGCAPVEQGAQEQAADASAGGMQDSAGNGDAPGESGAITAEELAMHNTAGDCWVVYGGNVYDMSGTAPHPNMEETFYSHCGDPSSFEEAAKARHGSRSSEERVANYGIFVGAMEG